jgi:uncharacterized protein with GYD domain
MITYITLYKYTQQGMQTIKQSPERIEQARHALEKAGARLKAVYLTTGRYDLVAISEWPSEQSAMSFLLGQGAAGYVTSETLRAFDEASFKKIVAGLT